MSLANSIYNAVFKRTSTMVLAVVVSAFVFERTYDLATDYAFESHNKGKLYNDINKG